MSDTKPKRWKPRDCATFASGDTEFVDATAYDELEARIDWLSKTYSKMVDEQILVINQRDDHIFRLESAHAMGTNARILELKAVLEAVKDEMDWYSARDELARGFHYLMPDVIKVLAKKEKP